MATTAPRSGTRSGGRLSLGHVISGVVLLLVIIVVLGHVLGQPLLLAFVETGSMQPTLSPGDGFITVPPMLAGSISAGDIVIYDARELGDGGLTTHRVVRESEDGLITAGDANPFTDQAAGEAPVTRDRVVAVAVQISGQPLVIPGLGSAVGAVAGAVRGFQVLLADLLGTRSLLGLQGLAFLLLAVSIVGYIADLVLATPRKPRERRTSRGTGYRVSTLLVGVAVLIAAVGTIAMVAPSGSAVYLVDSVAPGANVEGGIPAGEQQTIKAPVTNAGLVPTYVVYDAASAGVTVPERPQLLWPRQRATVPVTLEAPPEPGRYERTVSHHRYLAVLPPGLMMALHRIHPVVAMAVVDGVLIAVFLGIGRVLVGSGRLRVRPSRERTTRIAVSRWLFGRDRPGD